MFAAGTPYSLLTVAERAAICRSAGACELCGTTTVTLAVDHDHNTDLVRGVLCFRCNLCVIYHLERGTIPAVGDDLVLKGMAYLDATSWQTTVALPGRNPLYTTYQTR